MRHTALPLALTLALASPAVAPAQESANDALLNSNTVSAQRLYDATNGVELRSVLAAHADSFATSDPTEAAQALGYIGVSYSREGMPDSAIAVFTRAVELAGRHDDRVHLAESLLLRLGPGDAERAREVMRPLLSLTPGHPGMDEMEEQGLFAWAHHLAGRTDSAATLFAPTEAVLSLLPEWRYRLACVAFGRSDWPRALTLLMYLAVLSRGQDRDVMEMMSRASEALRASRGLGPEVQRQIALRDRMEQQFLTRLGARRVGFTAADGFPLGGVLLVPTSRARPRAAVVLMALEDTLADYDSLAAGLMRMGHAVLLLEPRGSGHSVAVTCPLVDTWNGRKAEMQERVAEDVREAVAVLAKEGRADTTRYLLVGMGESAASAVEAARLDRRAKVLVLVSPMPSPVDRGAMRATVAALKRPFYFQTGPEDYLSWALIDSLYHVCDMRASRVADSDRLGTQATLFRRDPRVLARLKQWLADAWPPPARRRATPPSPRRKG